MVISWGEVIIPLHLWFILLEAPHFRNLRSQCPLGGTGGHVDQGHVKSCSVFSNLRLTREKYSSKKKKLTRLNYSDTFYSVRWPNTEVHFHTESPVCLKLRGRTHIHGINKCFFSSVAYADTTLREAIIKLFKFKNEMTWVVVLHFHGTKQLNFAVLYSVYQCTAGAFYT